ncbi:hypothetical protein LJC33_09290 [Eubacteriales bacterium OttesenSCG-928-N13]|nr:hypothetical protein [Eubacteriales bacterium OttesenSCG-928-N13]
MPLVGLILSISGFARQVVRVTDRYKGRLVVFIVYGLISLSIAIGAILGGLYYYSRNPDMFTNAGRWIWTQMTGNEQLPGEVPPMDYTDTGMHGLGEYEDPTMEDDLPEDDEPLPDDDFGEDGTVDPDELDQVPDDQSSGDIPSVSDLMMRSAGGELDDDDPEEFIAEEEEDDFGEEFDDADLAEAELHDFPFVYVVEDEEVVKEGNLDRAIYKVVLEDTETITDQDLLDLMDEIKLGSGCDVHTMNLYRDVSEFDSPFTIATAYEKNVGEEPTIERPAG